MEEDQGIYISDEEYKQLMAEHNFEINDSGSYDRGDGYLEIPGQQPLQLVGLMAKALGTAKCEISAVSGDAPNSSSSQLFRGHPGGV